MPTLQRKYEGIL